MAETGKKKGKGWVYALIGLALVGGGFAAWYFLRKRKDGDSSTINVENSSTTSTTTITSGGDTGSMGGSAPKTGGVVNTRTTQTWPLKYVAPPAPYDPRVEVIQKAINKYASAKGISKSYLPLAVDGKFGSKTQQAVQELSKSILGVSTSTISEGQFNTIKKYA